MDWVTIILAVLGGVAKFVQNRMDQGKLDQGEMLQIAKASAEIMRKSQYAKQALEEFGSMPESAVDDFLRNLGGPGGGEVMGDSK